MVARPMRLFLSAEKSLNAPLVLRRYCGRSPGDGSDLRRPAASFGGLGASVHVSAFLVVRGVSEGGRAYSSAAYASTVLGWSNFGGLSLGKCQCPSLLWTSRICPAYHGAADASVIVFLNVQVMQVRLFCSTETCFRFYQILEVDGNPFPRFPFGGAGGDTRPTDPKLSRDEVDLKEKNRQTKPTDKTEHGMEKTVQNQGRSPKMPKSESILKNTIECNLYPSDGPGKANSIVMKTVKTKWRLNSIKRHLFVHLNKDREDFERPDLAPVTESQPLYFTPTRRYPSLAKMKRKIWKARMSKQLCELTTSSSNTKRSDLDFVKEKKSK
ncbi:hypothetical protein Tco_1427339 [Tanacetum coccineum]